MTQQAYNGYNKQKKLSCIWATMLLLLFGFAAPALADWAGAVKQEMISQAPLETPNLSSIIDGLDVTISWTDVPEASGYTLYFKPFLPTPESVKSFNFGPGQTSGIFRWQEGDDFHISVEAYSVSGRKSGLSNVVSVSLPLYGESDIQGKVYISEPIAEARVCVATGNTREEAGHCAETDAAGMWQGLHVDLLTPPVRIEITGGQEGENPFEGTLSAYLPYRDVVISDHLEVNPDSEVSVNVLTTIIDRYMLKSGVDYETAVEKVLEFFNLPEDINIFSKETWEQNFSPAEFSTRCLMEEDGDFDLYVDSLVERIGNGEKEIMTPSNGIDWGTAFGKEIVKVGFGSWAGEIALGAAGGALFSKGLNMLLPVLGFDTTETHLQAIRDTLAKLQAEVGQISSKLDGLSKQLDSAVDELILNMTQIDLATATNRIDSNYDKMNSFALNAPIEEQAINDFAAQIILHSAIENDIQHIYSSMVPSGIKTGVLDALYNHLVGRIQNTTYENQGSELAFCYNALQLYFSELVAYQLKGSLLVANANSVKYGKNSSANKAFGERLQSYLDQEVEAFLTLVERFVLASTDARTMMYGDYRMFPEEVEDIFFHADFIAQQLSTKHDAGFVIRTLGDPPIADRFYTAPAKGAFRGELKKTSKNLYPAPIPEHYGVDYYLGWSKQTAGEQTQWRFTHQNQIAINKLVYPDPYAGNIPSRIPKTHSVTYFDFEKSGKFGYFDGNGIRTSAKTEGSTLYGHAVIIARCSPKFVDTQAQSKNKHGEWETYFAKRSAGAAGILKMKYVITDKYRGWDFWTQPPLPYANSEMAISTHLKNGETNEHQLDLNLQMKDAVDHKGFQYASKYDCLYFEYSWRFSLGNKDLLKIEDKNKKGFGLSNTYWRTQKKERNHTKTISFNGSETKRFSFASDSNTVDIGIQNKHIYGTDDSGSEAVFSHQIKKLELIPRP